MTASSLKLVTPSGYRALTSATLSDYIAMYPDLAARLGGKTDQWKVREVGDGNLNLVFIVEGLAGSFCVKQALPYVRLVGESWPLPLSRAHFEHRALVEQAKVTPRLVPMLYHHDAPMALTVMEFLTPHIILRKGLIRGIIYPRMAQHLGEFLALTLFHTSDLHLAAAEKKQRIAVFADNTALCKISEDLIFDEPYFKAPMNRNTAGIDDIVADFRRDAALKTAAQNLKWRFMNHAEAMIHGDLHTGSVMVTETDTRVIDPEFAFYGPMGFDVGAVIGNLLLAYFAQAGQAEKPGSRDDYAAWIVQQIPVLWQCFTATFRRLWAARSGDVYASRVLMDHAEASTAILESRLLAIWDDAVGFAAAKMIRRILGLAHVEDFESIGDENLRAACERRALLCAQKMMLVRSTSVSPADLICLAMSF